MAKSTAQSAQKITLINQQTKAAQDFEYAHGMRLLTAEERRGFTSWALPEDAPYTFKHGNIITRPVKESGIKAET